jgi:hypothetical protein
MIPEGSELLAGRLSAATPPVTNRTTFNPNLKGSQPNRCDAFSVEALVYFQSGGVVAAILNHRLMAGIPPG